MQLDSKSAQKPQGAPHGFNFDFGDRKTFMVPPPSERKPRLSDRSRSGVKPWLIHSPSNQFFLA